MTDRGGDGDGSRPTIDPVVIIGTGLVGASVGCALTRAGCEVHLEDRNPMHARVAQGVGAGTVEPVDPDRVRLVVAAVPPGVLADTIAAALHRFSYATVTDVGSVKTTILDRLWSSGADRSRYVGSHPMAGSQLSGPLTANADLFVDRTWVITPHRESAPNGIAAVSALAAVCGAREIRMDVADHDAAVARVSHLPHLLSALMAGHLVTVPSEQLQLAGQGLRDVTRIAGSDPGLWGQIVAANAEALVPELRVVHQRLGELIAAVETDPQHGADEHLGRALEGTRRIPGKHGLAPVAYAHVVVEIPDRPGALAQMFTDAGRAGANVEDLSIEHDPVRQVGYVSIAVLAGTADRLAAAMREAGWTAGIDALPAGTLAGVSSPQSSFLQRPAARPYVIAIDGPSGSGKSSTAKGVAARLGLDYLDTGAMYRSVTWLALNAEVDPDDQVAVARLVSDAVLDVSLDPGTAAVTIDGHDVTTAIREPVVSAAVSRIAAQPEVRRILIDRQRQIIAASDRGIVVEGRDITTVVAPDADLRLLLLADPRARVARRQAELGDAVHAHDVTDQVLRRDRDDSAVAQFEQAADGVTVVDSTSLNLEQVIDRVCELAEGAA